VLINNDPKPVQGNAIHILYYALMLKVQSGQVFKRQKYKNTIAK